MLVAAETIHTASVPSLAFRRFVLKDPAAVISESAARAAQGENELAGLHRTWRNGGF